MQVSNNPLLADMQRMIADMQMQQGFSQIPTQQTSQATSVEGAGSTSRSNFGQVLKTAVDNVNGLQLHANELRDRIEMGDPNVSIAEGMIATQKATIAFEAAVQVRNKFVEAYEKIMQMPV